MGVGVAEERLDRYLKELNREDQRLEKELTENYAEALDLLRLHKTTGEVESLASSQQNIISIIMNHHGAPMPASSRGDYTALGDFSAASTPHTTSNKPPPFIVEDAVLQNLLDTVRGTRDSAEALCSRVRVMDVSASRIQKTLSLVEELLAIRTASEEVHGNISTKDYETAAKAIAKYKTTKSTHPDVLKLLSSDEGVSVVAKLEDAGKKLSSIVNQEFEQAIKNKDQKAVSRFAKLFYPLGLAESAVLTYIQFIRERIRESAAASISKLRRLQFNSRGGASSTSASNSSNSSEMPPYAETLWSVFAHISDILQHNKNNLETEFGVENYVTFLKNIYAEVSSQQVKILQLFKDQEYGKYLGGGGSSGSGSASATTGSTTSSVQNKMSGLLMSGNIVLSAAGSRGGNQQTPQSLIAQNKDKVRLVLAQMQALLQKTETFDCFIRQLIADAHTAIMGSGHGEQYEKTPPEASDKNIEMITHSIVGEAEATKAAQDLVSSYVVLTKELLQIEIKQAIEGDEVDVDDEDPGVSSMVDDVFFVLKASIEASMETCNLVAVCCIINEVGMFLSKDSLIYQAIEANLREALPAYRVFVSDVRHITDFEEDRHALAGFYDHMLTQKAAMLGGAMNVGAVLGVDHNDASNAYSGLSSASATTQKGTTSGTKEAKSKIIQSGDSWPHACNNCYKCVDYLDRLIESVRLDFGKKTDEQGELLFPEDLEQEKKTMFEHCLQNLGGLRGEYQGLALHIPLAAGGSGRAGERQSIPGIPRNTVNALKHHLIPALLPFEEANFNVSEQEFNDWQVNDLFVNNFIHQISKLHEHVSKCYLPEVVAAILNQLIEQTCNRLATHVAKKPKISLYGGLQFDQDVRALMNYFLSLMSSSLSSVVVRKKFKRLTQISSLLSLEAVRELKDFYGQQKWDLRNAEIRLFLVLRFSESEVERDAGFLRGGGFG